MKTDEEIIEELANLEHIQWEEWSINLSSKEKLSFERLKRWNKLWKNYSELTEAEKEQDRVYAREVFKVFKQREQERLKEILKYIDENSDEDNPMLSYKNRVLINLREKIKEMIK